MTIEIRCLRSGDEAVLANVVPEVFDNALDPEFTRVFLADPRHHIVVAVEDGMVVGFASAVNYLHPDKSPELWIDEVGVAPEFQGKGTGKRLLRELLDLGRSLGCREAWVLTDRANAHARSLYASLDGSETVDHVMVSFDL